MKPPDSIAIETPRGEIYRLLAIDANHNVGSADVSLRVAGWPSV